MKPRIIFVDDEPRVLEGIENLLFDLYDEWEISFAESGLAALAAMSNDTFDILVTDMKMPGMDGAELLQLVRTWHPRVIRIVLSGHADRACLESALPFAHEFLTKPCLSDELIETLRRLVHIQRQIAHPEVLEMICSLRDLPVRTSIYHELKRRMRDPQLSMGYISNLLSQDVAMITKILHVASSAYFCRRRPPQTLQQAITILGMDCVRALVLEVEIFDGLRSVSPIYLDSVYTHSTEIADICASSLEDPSQFAPAHLAGLLHDTGVLAMFARYPELMQMVEANADHYPGGWMEAEARILGFTHQEVGAYLLRLWGVDPEVTNAIENHHRQAPSQDPLGIRLTLAHYVSESSARFANQIYPERALPPNALNLLQKMRDLYERQA